MKLHLKTIAGFAGLAWLLAACNYPGVTAPTPFSFPTANATLTAVFQPTATAPAADGQPSPTPTQFVFSLPTPTSAAAAPTPAPAATATGEPPVPTVVPIPIEPTRTPAPVSIPGARSGPSMQAFYLTDAPTIDGEFDEWTLDRTPIDQVTAGEELWTNAGDLSARVMLGWDEDNLYVAARVMDDRFVQNATEEYLYLGDSLEILLDTDVTADYYRTTLDGDDYQLGISPGQGQPGDDPEAYLWFPRAEEGVSSRVEIGATAVDDGYRVEARIPWSTFDVSPNRGQHFGFVFSVSDNDNSRRDVQQSMVSSTDDRILTDPTTWGDLQLVGNPGAGSDSGGARRGGVRVRAPFVDTPPNLDGSLAGWNSERYALDKLTYDTNGQWQGKNDLSGSLMAAWDDDYLYLAAEVVDDRYVQNTSGENLFLGDSLEILMDADLAGDFNTSRLSGDDFQIGISPGSPAPGQNPDAYLWFPQSAAGRASQVNAAAVPTATGYNIEVAIPWNLFGVDPRGGQRFGFIFSMSDNDETGRNVQQSMVSDQDERVLTNPTTWGELVISDQ